MYTPLKNIILAPYLGFLAMACQSKSKNEPKVARSVCETVGVEGSQGEFRIATVNMGSIIKANNLPVRKGFLPSLFENNLYINRLRRNFTS